MKRVSDSAMCAWFGAALGLTVVGCASLERDFPSPEKAAAAKAAKGEATAAKGTEAPAGTSAASAAKPAEPAFVPADLQYKEIPAGARLVVVGTAKGADAAAKGGRPASYVSEIGYGANGQTVYFENKPEGIEKALKAEFAKRHPELAVK